MILVDLDFFTDKHVVCGTITIPLQKWEIIRSEIDKMNSDYTIGGQHYFGTMPWWFAIKEHGHAPIGGYTVNPSINIYVDDTPETKEAIQSIRDKIRNSTKATTNGE